MTTPSRLFVSTIARRLQAPNLVNCVIVAKTNGAVCSKIITRNAGFQGSREVRPIEEYPEVEVVQNAPEWKYVERVLPPKTIPKPEKRAEYASGWKWPTAAEKDPSELKYFVARTKNHMVPVYLETSFRGTRRITVIRRIQGDIWALEKDLRAVVEEARGKMCASRINEMSQQIQFHGDYQDVIREYLKANGF